jgi:hypothetical protein
MNAENLDELRWKKRVVIIYAPAGSGAQLAGQKQLLGSADADLKEPTPRRLSCAVAPRTRRSLIDSSLPIRTSSCF